MSPPIALPAFDDNYIWVREDASGRAIVVDPGDATPVLAACAQGLNLVGILITHHHDDHTGGVRRLQEELDLPCYGPADPRIPGHSQSVRPGQRLRPENYDGEFEVIDSPGHTLTHLSFRIEDELYCGDTLFSLGCGRLFEGTPEQMHASLTRLAALPSDTRVFCAHEYTLANARFARTVEPSNRELEEFERRVSARRAEGLPSLPSTLAEEHACNPFLRCAEPRVQAAAEQRAGRRLGSEVEVFAVLRAWKDEFRA